MIEGIRQAEVRIWLEIYILEPDQIGLKFIKELTQAAKRGVQFVFLFLFFNSI